MARYIDADQLIKKIYPMGIGDGKYTINAKAVKFAIDNTPTADVVPKSEVDKWHNAYKAFRKKYLDCKKEAEELDDEAERLKKECLARCHHQSELLKKYNTCKTGVAREIFEEIETALKLYKQYDLKSGTYFECYLEADIAERKKKYIGESDVKRDTV